MPRLLFFGRLRDIAGGEMTLDAPGEIKTAAALIDWLGDKNPDLGAALQDATVRLAVDRRFVARDAEISGAQEIAFMPPLSGG